ncbi:MAG: beta-galactosidase, partial [Lentisphaeria bacterium]|nr:beta-galactosidase [Lentisphaeria bacterium]
MSRVEFKNRSIIIDGKPVQIISGAMHYFRIPREYWRDRMEKAVQLGMNCIETYMCWNLHEREEGSFDFSGMLDFEAYIRLAAELGLYVIVRPGPFICAEWDNGGFPCWLMNKQGIRYRRMNVPYIDALTKYMNVILPRLKALQYDDGGPVIAMQIENEYGSYSSDREYLEHLRNLYLNAGVTVPLFTADGVALWADAANLDLCIRGGKIKDTHVCLNFGSRALDSFDIGRDLCPDDPPFCMEFWCGWFDAWGCGQHHTRSAESTAEELEDMLSAGASVNFYMYHGGTNFEFTAGANGTSNADYAPDVTSYDYDALLDEAGDPTEKYFAVQQVIRKYAPDRPFGTPEKSRKMPARKLDITAIAPLSDNLDKIAKKVTGNSALTFEELNHPFGYVLYRNKLNGAGRGCFELEDVRDRADLYLNGNLIHTYYRKGGE